MRIFNRISLVVPVFILIGCLSETVDISRDPLFGGVIEKEYVTVVDTIPFKFIGKEEGVNVKVPGTTGMPLISELPKSFPFEYHDRQILGVLPAGAQFRIVRITRWKTFEDSGIEYTGVIVSSGPFQGKEMDVTWLAEMTYYPNVQKFNPKYVEPVNGK